MLKNKKAVSAVVATVLIILITIAAVTIIWSAIIPMIDNQIEGAGDCLGSSQHLLLNEVSTCYKLTWHNATNKSDYGYAENKSENKWTVNGSEISIGVKRLQGSFDVVGINIKAFVNGNTVSEKIIKPIEVNSEYIIKFAKPEFFGVERITYAPLIKTQNGECSPIVPEATAVECK